jgi:serine-type D-Ala-D-Ala carboxypeptidase/endopeptidase (penicillin-binding protein 4)
MLLQFVHESHYACNMIQINSMCSHFFQWLRSAFGASGVGLTILAIGCAAMLGNVSFARQGADVARTNTSFTRQNASIARPNDALPPAVAERLNTASIPVDALGAVVMRARDGRVMWSHNALKSMQPASTLKVLTSIVALETMLPTYRGRTELRRTGDIRDGMLLGDLTLKGFADADFDWQALLAMLVTLKHQGVDEIRGDLIVDRSFFQPARMDVGIAPFDESPEFRYNVIPDALLLNTYLQQLEITSTDTALKITSTPLLDRVSFVSQMTLVDKPCADWEDVWKLPNVVKAESGDIQVTLQGEFPKNCPIATSIAVLDRSDYVDRLFRSLWRSLGGQFTGAVREGSMNGETKLVAEHRSRTLAELGRDINKRSDNPITRLTYLTLGALAKNSSNEALATTSTRAERVVRDWLKRKQIDDPGLVLDNGSGLSRIERIAPLTLAHTLRVARASVWAPEFLSTLPIAGVDGGVKKRLSDNALAQRARLKTGTLRDVTAIAGYAPDASGETYVVVAMVNHPLAVSKVARPIVDSLVEWVSQTKMTRARALNRTVSGAREAPDSAK